MERATGIEPATSSLGSWRSTIELRPLREKEKDQPLPKNRLRNDTKVICQEDESQRERRLVVSCLVQITTYTTDDIASSSLPNDPGP